MIKYKIITTKVFEEELQEIYEYISFSLIEPKIAYKLYYKIINSISKLNYFPKKYFKLTNYNLHRMIINNYVIIYQVDNINQKVYILHIFHNAQDYLNLL